MLVCKQQAANSLTQTSLTAKAPASKPTAWHCFDTCGDEAFAPLIYVSFIFLQQLHALISWRTNTRLTVWWI